MLELSTHHSRAVVETIRNFVSSPFGIFLYAAATGVIGIAILLLFFSLVVSPSDLTLLLPVIIGFNGAAGGYAIGDKRAFSPFLKIGKLALAALFTIAGSTLLLLFCPWEPLLDGDRYFLAGVFALGSVLLGGWLATKSKALLNR